MWKWIVGSVLAIVLLLAGKCYAGYRRITDGTVAQTTIGEPPERVFASLAHPDSIGAWMTRTAGITSTGKGAFQPGDTVRIAAYRASNGTAAGGQVLVIREVKPPVLLVVDAVRFNPMGEAVVTHVRRDSLVAAGDSTIVISLFLPVPFVRNAARDTGGTRASAVMSTAEKVITGASRMQRQTELDQLKAYFDRSRHPDD